MCGPAQPLVPAHHTAGCFFMLFLQAQDVAFYRDHIYKCFNKIQTGDGGQVALLKIATRLVEELPDKHVSMRMHGELNHASRQLVFYIPCDQMRVCRASCRIGLAAVACVCMWATKPKMCC